MNQTIGNDNAGDKVRSFGVGMDSFSEFKFSVTETSGDESGVETRRGLRNAVEVINGFFEAILLTENLDDFFEFDVFGMVRESEVFVELRGR